MWDKMGRYGHVKGLVPVGVQSLFDDTGCVSLLCIDGDDRERVGETEDFAFGETIGGDDW